MTDGLPQTLRDGRYSIVRVLGAGAQGETLDAVDTRQERPVAIKRFLIRGAPSWKNVELAEREARVLSHLSHPALPHYLDHFEEQGALYLVMDKIEGASVASLLRQGVSFSQQDVLRFLQQAADVLTYLHQRAPPVIHRDLKPGNVLLRADGSYALVDFGSVRDSLKPEGGSTVVGTFGYMAPEQFQGRALPASDVYAVGVTALTMLTGRAPEQLPHKGLAIDVESALRGSVSQSFISILKAMLEPDPDRRAVSIQPLLQRVFQAGDPQHPPEPETTVLPGHSRRYSPGSVNWSHPDDSWETFWRSVGGEWTGRLPHRHWHRQAERLARKLRRKAERARRFEERSELGVGRTSQRPWRRSHATTPWALVFAHIVVTVAEVLANVILRTAVPLLLTLLAIVFGPALRRAATRAGVLGAQLASLMARLRQELEHPLGADYEPGPDGSQTQHGRVAEPDSGTLRVRVPEEPPTDEHSKKAESSAPEQASTPQPRSIRR